MSRDIATDVADDGVATLTLARPERRNALSIKLRNEITEQLDGWATDPAVRAVVLTGAGSTFCAGFDLDEFARDMGVDLDATFERWPWDRLVQIHYAGGRWRDGVLIDSHDAATSEAVWTLYDRIVARASVKGVILERDERLPPFSDLLDEVARNRKCDVSL